jgi:RNA polymerase sigma-70 factor (ECF subfamily)
MSDNGHAGNFDWIRSALGSYECQLTRYAQRITGDAERARDVVQETFLRLCREKPSHLDGHLAEWLFTVCRNYALDVRRKESRMSTFADPEVTALQTREPAPLLAAQMRDETGRILKLLDRLPDNQREVIRLKFQNGLSYREISRVANLSVSNVGYLIHQGLKTLRSQMNPET